jgi:RNA polymerase sigma factor (sigma-70 family)
MGNGRLRSFIQHLQHVATGGTAGGLPDGDLLQRWVQLRDEASFELLVWRHGSLVVNVCRRVLRREQDVEDAFQATFLVLMRKAASISKRDLVGSWLYKVAYRVALEAAKRGTRDTSRPLGPELAAPGEDHAWRDVRPILDEEVNRLPPKYRRTFVACYLEGKSTDEVAEELGCPRGTVATRLAWARDRLRNRLTRRGVVLSSGALAMLLSQHAASASVAAPLVGATVQAGMHWSAGATLIGGSARAAILAQAVLGQMQVARLALAALVVVLMTIAGTTTAFWTYRAMVGGSARVGPTVPPGTADPGLLALLRPEDRAHGNPWLIGDVAVVSPDSRDLMVADRHSKAGEPRRHYPVHITEQTRITYELDAPLPARPEPGYIAFVWVESGRPDVVTRIRFYGRRDPLWANVAGKVMAVAADGQTITIAPTQRPGQPLPKLVDIRITKATSIKFSTIGEGSARLQPGQDAQVWLEAGTGNTADRLWLSLPAPRPDQLPDLVGELVELVQVSAVLRRLTLQLNPHDPRDRSPRDVDLAQETAIVFRVVPPNGARLEKGYQVSVWFADAARKTAKRIELEPKDPRTAFSGRIKLISDDQRRLTIEVADAKPPRMVEVVLTDKTRLHYSNVRSGGAQLTQGYFAQVWLREGSSDTVDEARLKDESEP